MRSVTATTHHGDFFEVITISTNSRETTLERQVEKVMRAQAYIVSGTDDEVKAKAARVAEQLRNRREGDLGWTTYELAGEL